MCAGNETFISYRVVQVFGDHAFIDVVPGISYRVILGSGMAFEDDSAFERLDQQLCIYMQPSNGLSKLSPWADQPSPPHTTKTPFCNCSKTPMFYFLVLSVIQILPFNSETIDSTSCYVIGLRRENSCQAILLLTPISHES